MTNNRWKILKPPPRLEKPPWSPTEHTEGRQLTADSAAEALPDLSIRKILVPFGFSDTSALLLHRLVPLAERTGAGLHLLHVIDPFSLADDRPVGARGTLEDKLAAAQNALDRWRDRIIRGRAAAFTSVRIGDRTAEIVARAGEIRADLIVMATRGGRASSASFPSSTAEGVISDASCPALTLPVAKVHDSGPDYDGFPPSSWRTLLMPVDFSACAGRALKYAAALSVENRAKLVLLNVMLEGARKGDSGQNSQEEHRRMEWQAKRRLKEWVKGEMGLPLEFESVIWAGIPSRYAVPLEARLSNVDLILMPVRKGSGRASSGKRSLRDLILRSASCPILSLHEGIRRQVFAWG